MRKISKSRTDDDVISSTNGSLANDEQPESNRNKDSKESDQDSDANDSVNRDNDEASDVSKGNKRGRPASKSNAKKRKSGKDKKPEEEYEVEKIIDSKKIKGKLHYLIRWKGYSAENDTWEPENTLSCPDLIGKYNEEKENSKNKERKPGKKSNKRKSKSGKEAKTPPKRAKMQWDKDSADENAEYEVERIMEVHHKKNGSREFLIHWKGWSSKFDSWEPESNLNCPELIKKFMDKDPTSGRRLSKRRGQRQRVRYDNAE